MLWTGVAYFLVLSSATYCHCATVPRNLADNPPTVTLDSATVTGYNDVNLTKFLGIHYAEAPKGNLRFNVPQPVAPYSGSINATSYGFSCPQQIVTSPISFQDLLNISLPWLQRNNSDHSDPDAPPEDEDCLTINIIKPRNITADAKLPVVVWIYGGGFERGNVESYEKQGMRIVESSIALGKPIIWAAMNYRISAWGFLASQEVLDAQVGNAGLRDQYVAIQWVNRYIGQFGGDNSKVILWGQSAGAISASLQMLAFGGNSTGLFRGAFMQSGSPIPVGNVTGGQMWYDNLVQATNCTSSNDTLTCLREAPFDTLSDAINNTPNYFSYQGLSLVWSPRSDGQFLQQNPQRLVEQGLVANVSFVSGDVDDEGTLFSLSSRNITTDKEYEEFVQTYFLPGANDSTLEPLWSAYPSNPKDGSPFNTEEFNSITPQYKRIAAFQGDAVFQAPRRFFMQHRSGQQKMWAYLSRKLKFTPIVGSFHGSDLGLDFLDEYVINFAQNLDPNGGDQDTQWPEYTKENPVLYEFPTVGRNPKLTDDTYRLEPMNLLMNLSLENPL